MSDAPISIIITEAETDPVRLALNGRSLVVPVGIRQSIEASFLTVLADANLTFKQVGEDDTSLAAAVVDADRGDGSDGGDTPPEIVDTSLLDAATFDPEAVVKLTVPGVEAVVANLGPDELEAVRAAEIDREAPRVGVLEAVESALEAFPAAEAPTA